MKEATTTVNFRLSNTLRSKLEELSKEYEISISDMVRIMIADYGNKYIDEEEYEDILCNNGITQIVAWLYQKKINPYALKQDYRGLYSSILSIREHSCFSPQLKKEFLKVEQDLVRIMSLPPNNNYFEFPLDTNPQKFDYQILEKFIDQILHKPSKAIETIYLG